MVFISRFTLATRAFKVGAEKGNEKEGRYHGQATPAYICTWASSNMPGFSCSYNLYVWVTNFLQYIAGNYCHANLRGRKSLRRYDVMMLSLVVCTVCLWHLPFTIDKIEPNRAMCNQPSWLQQCSVSDCSCLKISIMG